MLTRVEVKEKAFGMYIGQYVVLDKNNSTPIGKLCGLGEDKYMRAVIIDVRTATGIEQYDIDDSYLILRPLSAMTEEEITHIATDIYGLVDGTEGFNEFFDFLPDFLAGNGKIEVDMEIISILSQYLISKGYDIFDLNSRGWAIYKDEK